MAQHVCEIPSLDVIFIDTVEVQDPIVLGFIEPSNDSLDRRVGLLILSKCTADTIPYRSGEHGFYQCLSTDGYQFYLPGRFTTFLRSALARHPNSTQNEFLESILDTMLEREKDVVFIKRSSYGQEDAPVCYRGIESAGVKHHLYWMFLVKNSTIHKLSSDEELFC
jgi:hypothetical protein